MHPRTPVQSPYVQLVAGNSNRDARPTAKSAQARYIVPGSIPGLRIVVQILVFVGLCRIARASTRATLINRATAVPQHSSLHRACELQAVTVSTSVTQQTAPAYSRAFRSTAVSKPAADSHNHGRIMGDAA